jgi:hypothetical protein
MKVFSSSINFSFRGAEKQSSNVRVFISKYDLWMITIKEHQFHDRATQYYTTEKNRVILP